MNCLCGLPAKDLKVVSSNSPNFGKTFFICPTQPKTCNFFQFADEPLSSRNQYQQPQKSRQQQAPSSSSSNGPVVKVHLDAYDESTGTFWFVVYPTNAEIIGLIQKLDRNMFKYNNSVKIWMLNFAIYDTFVNELQASGKNYTVEEIPKFAIRGIKVLMKTRDVLLGDPELNLSESLSQTLLPFQIEGVKFVVRRNGRALIGDEMGCGKTLQAIAVLQHYQNLWPALILVPPSLVDQWARELREHVDLNASDLKIVKKGNDVISGKICIVSYTALEGLVQNGRISTDRFGVVIADESHLLKSKEAKRTNNALPFLRKAQVAVCLTGTPSTNRPVELYTQLNGLLPSIFSDYDSFTRRYCDAKPSRFGGGTDVNGASNEKELNLLLKSLVMIRRLKDEVVKLPEKNREILRVDADPSFIDQLNNCKNELKAADDAIMDPRNDYDTKQQLQNDSRKILINYINVTGLAKVNRVKEELVRIIEDLKERNKRRSSDTVIVLEECEDLFEDRMDEISRDQVTYKPAASSYQYDDDNDPPVVLKKRNKKTKRSRIISDVSDSDSDVEHDTKAGDSNKDDREKAGEPSKITEEDQSRDVWKSILNGSKAVSLKGRRSSKSRDFATDKKKEGDAWGSLQKKTKKIVTPTIGKKILIFAHHKSVMDSLEDCIRNMSLDLIRIDGDVSVCHRDNLINTFQNEESVEIALLSITACGTGLNLTRASIVIFAEISWSVGNMLQAEDRVHRIGQNAATVRIIYVLAGWSDDIVWGQIQKKHAVINATVGMGVANKPSANSKKSPGSKSQSSISQYMSSASTKDSQSSTRGANDIVFPTSKNTSAAPTNLSASISMPAYAPVPIYAPPPMTNSITVPVSVPTTTTVPAKVVMPPTPSSTRFNVTNANGNKRPLSPTTMQKIEESYQLALERKRSKVGVRSLPLPVEVSPPPIVKTAGSQLQKAPENTYDQSSEPHYSFKTAKNTLVNVDERSIQYVEKKTNIFQSFVSTEPGTSTFNLSNPSSSSTSTVSMESGSTINTNTVSIMPLPSMPAPAWNGVGTAVSATGRSID